MDFESHGLGILRLPWFSCLICITNSSTLLRKKASVNNDESSMGGFITGTA